MTICKAWKYPGPGLSTLVDSLRPGKDSVMWGSEEYGHSGLLTYPSNVPFTSDGAVVTVQTAAGMFYIPDPASGIGVYYGGLFIVDGDGAATPDNPVQAGEKGGILQLGTEEAGGGAKVFFDELQVRDPGADAVCMLFANQQNFEGGAIRITGATGSAIGVLVDFGTKNFMLNGGFWVTGPTTCLKCTTTRGTQQTSKVKIYGGGLVEASSVIVLEDVAQFTMQGIQFNHSTAVNSTQAPLV